MARDSTRYTDHIDEAVSLEVKTFLPKAEDPSRRAAMKHLMYTAIAMVAPQAAHPKKARGHELAHNHDPESIENFRKIHNAKGFSAKDAFEAFGRIRHVK